MDIDPFFHSLITLKLFFWPFLDRGLVDNKTADNFSRRYDAKVKILSPTKNDCDFRLRKSFYFYILVLERA